MAILLVKDCSACGTSHEMIFMEINDDPINSHIGWCGSKNKYTFIKRSQLTQEEYIKLHTQEFKSDKG